MMDRVVKLFRCFVHGDEEEMQRQAQAEQKQNRQLSDLERKQRQVSERLRLLELRREAIGKQRQG